MKKKIWWRWLALLLLPVALLLPLIGEKIQQTYIGNEEYCCASFLIPEVADKVERAKSLHWLSNIIIGTSIVLAILIVIIMIYILYHYVISQISAKSLRNITKITVGVITVPVVILLLCVAFYFVFDNHEYYVHSAQPPDNGIYGDFFYKELFYLRNQNI